jgi:hypothetical protein
VKMDQMTKMIGIPLRSARQVVGGRRKTEGKKENKNGHTPTPAEHQGGDDPELVRTWAGGER